MTSPTQTPPSTMKNKPLRSRWWQWLQSQQKPRQEAVRLHRRRIYIVPSHGGLMFTTVLLVMLLGSMNYSNSMGYILTFLLASMGLVSALHTQRNLLGLHISSRRTAPVFAGEAAHFQIWLDNREQSARTALQWEQIEDSNVFSNAEEREAAAIRVDVPANQQISLTITRQAQQRGWLPLKEICVYTRFPSGLFYAWSYINLDCDVLVYPQPIGNRMLSIGKHAQQPTTDSVAHSHSGEDFIGYRNYQTGDSPRHVDWKAAARERGWLVKQFGGEAVVTIWLRWADVAHFNNQEAALSQLTLWVLLAQAEGAEYGLDIPGTQLGPDQGEAHQQACLSALALFDKPL